MGKIKVLIVEDSKERIKRFSSFFEELSSSQIANLNIFWARDYTEASQLICSETKFDLIFLDHDLSIEDENFSLQTKYKNGYDIAELLVENKSLDLKENPFVIIHSMNPIGAEAINKLLKESGFFPVSLPFFIITKLTLESILWQVDKYKNKS